jgi:hypothetical protein
MLCAKGYRVVFTMVDGAVYSPPASASLLHDERGVDWPARSGLVMPFARTGQKLLQPTPEVKRYFGDFSARRTTVAATRSTDRRPRTATSTSSESARSSD